MDLRIVRECVLYCKNIFATAVNTAHVWYTWAGRETTVQCTVRTVSEKLRKVVFNLLSKSY
jgi:hypothetical protein